MKIKKYILSSLCAFVLLIGSLTACKKQDDNETKNTEEAISTASVDTSTEAVVPPQETVPSGTDATTEGDKQTEAPTLTETEFKRSSLPFRIQKPGELTLTEVSDEVYVDTSEYMFYAFGMDTYNDGAVCDTDVIALLNASDRLDVVNDILRLRDFKVSQSEDIRIYRSINDMRGYQCPMSSMTFEDRDGNVINGSGFVMLYGNKNDVGLYVVLGILKKSTSEMTENDDEILNLLNTSALSLQANEGETYELWTETMPDGQGVRAVFKKDLILKTDKESDGIYLYYGESASSYFLIRHYKFHVSSTSEEQLRSFISGVSPEIQVSDITEVQGKQSYSKVVLSSTDNGQQMQEIICVSVNEEGSTWLVDLFGTVSEVEAQMENLNILLWSLQED